MNYLNLETSVLHSPEYIGCKPVARATWLNVMMWCAGQENGGRIAGAKQWGSRQWQQTCGVTLNEVNLSAPLLAWDGDDLVAWRYPLDREDDVRRNRELGRKGGLAKAKNLAGAKANATSEPPNPAVAIAPTKRNGKEEEGKEKEEEGKDTASTSGGPSRHTWLARVQSLGHREWWEKKWFSAEKTGWMSGRSPITNWEAHQDSQMLYFRSFEREQAAKNTPPDTEALERENREAEERRIAKEKELQSELQAALAEGRE